MAVFPAFKALRITEVNKTPVAALPYDLVN